ncbi:MAG: hypothetical protein II180_00965, partial [Proteobacteria bacterium]|nr:hypothetical protein [Pseudomonadota bacterium]
MSKHPPKNASLEHEQIQKQQTKGVDSDASRLLRVWRDQFAALSTHAQQYELHCLMVERLYWKIIYYMRRYPERLMSTHQTYSDRCIGHEELMQMMGHQFANGSAEQWLYDHHVPVKSEALDHIIVLNAKIHEFLIVESRCAIASIMRHFELSQDETEILGALVIIFSDASMLRLLMVAWADFSVRMPTVNFICDLLTDTPNKKEIIKQMLSKDGKLRRMRLVLGIDTETFPTHTPQAYTRLIVEQPVLDAWFDRMSDHAPLPYVFIHQYGVPKQSLIVDSTILEELEYVLSSHHPHLCLVGQPHSGRRTICISIALQQYQKSILEIDICRAFLGVSLTEMESCLSIIMREALLAGGMLMLRCDRLADDQALISRLKECQSQLARIVSQFPGEIILLATHEDAILDDIFGKPNYIHISPPDQKASKEIWKRALSPWSDFSEIEQMSDVFSKNYQIPIGNIN